MYNELLGKHYTYIQLFSVEEISLPMYDCMKKAFLIYLHIFFPKNVSTQRIYTYKSLYRRNKITYDIHKYK